MGGATARRLRDAGCQMQLLPADPLVPAAPAEQPHAPRAAGRRRPRRVHRRRRRRRLVAASRDEASRRVARHDGAHRGADRGGAAGRVRRELARMLRRDPDVAAALAARSTPAGPAEAMLVKSSPSDRATASRVVFQMLIEGAVTQHRHQHAVFPAGPRAAARAGARRAARRPRARHRAGPRHRPAAGAAGQPAHVRRAARGRRAHPRVPAGDDARQGADGRRRVGGHRDDQRRQPIVRAQRRSQRRVPRAGGHRAAAPRLRSGPGGERRVTLDAWRRRRAREARRAGLLDSRRQQ